MYDIKYVLLLIYYLGNHCAFQYVFFFIKRHYSKWLTRLRSTCVPLNKMFTISQTTFSNIFSRRNNFEFWLKFCGSLFPRVNWQKPSTDLDNVLAPYRRQAISWTNARPIRWRIYTALGGDVDSPLCRYELTHWGRVTHICVSKLTITGSDNGLSPGRRQAIIQTNDVILWNGPSGINISEILIGIQTFSFKKMRCKMSSPKWHPFSSAPMC